MSQEHRRLAAIMFTDIVGYSQIVQRDETVAFEILREHGDLLGEVFKRFDGIPIKSTGDGFLVEFISAIQAVQCAVEIQKAISQRNETEAAERRFAIRIGIHLGDILHRDNDVYGDDVNIASRIQPIAEPGGVCISERVYDQVRGKMEIRAIRLGPQDLKNIATPVELYKLVLPWEKSPRVSFRGALGRHPRKRGKYTFFMGLLLGLVLQFVVVILINAKGWNSWTLVSSILPLGGTQSAYAGERSIAVLPFVDLSPEMDNEYFSDGMTEELINALSKLEGVRVPGRTSSFAYKDTNESLRAIGRALGVETVLEGSVRKAGDRIKITVSHRSASDDRVLWSDTYERDMEDIFKVQEEITHQIVKTLKGTLDIADEEAFVEAPTEDMDAYTCYLDGRASWNRRTQEGLLKARDCFEEAIRIDPNFARAYSGLADTYHLLERYGFLPEGLGAEEARKKVEEYARKAIELDPNLAEAHASLGTVFEYQWEWEKAEESFERAVELNPGNADARQWYASLLSKFGRFEEAIEQMERAAELEPFSPSTIRALGSAYFYAGQVEKAIEQNLRALEIDPEHPGVRRLLAWDYSVIGEFDKALEEIDREEEISGSTSVTRLNRAEIQARMGNPEPLRKILSDEAFAATREQSLFEIGNAHFLLGDLDEGFRLWQKAVEERNFVATHIKTEQVSDEVKNDPRYAELIRKIGLPE
jgi:TolB-like protein/class 3 adenylate cyclase/tetratricopeptide (TPR) repeat protein